MSEVSSSSPGWIMRLGAIGDRPDDPDTERLKHRLLVFMGVLMSGGGLLWGSIAASQSLLLPAVIPYGYTAVTVLNLSYFRLSKNFEVVRFIQVLLSLLLPFLFQWVLGGFATSGAVMLWAMLAIVGSMTFSASRTSLKWLLFYCGLTVVSGLIDRIAYQRFGIEPPPGVRTAFFVTNIVVISGFVFGLMIYLLSERERVTQALAVANERITELNEHLEDQVAERTAELASSLTRTRAILSNMADGLVAVNGKGIVQAANPAFSEILLIEHELDGKPFADVLPNALAELVQTSLAECEIGRTEIPMPGERTGAAVASPISTEGGPDTCEGAVVILRDVTLEKEIDRMKTDFIATVSHELRTPLTSVLGFAKLTKNKLEQSILEHVPESNSKAQRAVKQVRGNIDIIVSEGQRLTALINDVLDISKMEAGRMEWKVAPVEVTALVDRALEATNALFQDGKVTAEREVAENLPVVEGDFDRLLQVLINLLSNAAKFTEEGAVTVRAQPHPDGVEIAVVDTGDGIAPTDQHAIFEKFKQVGDTLTSKPQGTGLGLPICRQIVTAHGGNISVESKVGEGSTFRVVLPLPGKAESTLTVPPPTISSPPPARSREPIERRPELDELMKRIQSTVDQFPAEGADVLVVDDDASLREMLRQQLTERGYEVRLASNGYDAIQSVRSKRPDVVVLDVMMPEISGFDVAAVLKSDPTTQAIPIIILSIVQDSDRGYRLGVDRYLTKPAEAETLIGEVERVLSAARRRRRVLLVDPEQKPAESVVRLLESKGFEVVGACDGASAIGEARSKKPDAIIVEPRGHRSRDLVRAIRLEKDFENVLVVQLMGNEADAPA